jgi:hypothetical protein
MKKLLSFAEKSTLMNIRIKYGTESFQFNLFEELQVNENIINDEIKVQPSISGFLGTLLTKLERIREDKEAEMQKIYHKLFALNKSKVVESGRYASDDLSKSMAIANRKYQDALKNYLIAKENASHIKTCVNAFEQRSFLIQTLSANLRNKS